MPNIFPEFEPTELPQTSTVAETYGKELAFDFQKGDFIMENGSPKIVEGIQALKTWIEKTIRTARYRFPIYTFQYGCELEDIIGYDLPRAVLESEVQRVIREALVYDNRIEDVRDFIIERGDDWLRITFTVITTLNDVFFQEVNVYV